MFRRVAVSCFRLARTTSLPICRRANLRSVALGQTPKLTVPIYRLCSTQATETTEPAEEAAAEEYHSIISERENAIGESQNHQFKAETMKLLEIVAKSLYSDREIFVRELISNSSDALEKLRYERVKSPGLVGADGAPISAESLEIHLATDDSRSTFTIQDTGIGMSSQELIDNLGTIAKSGSAAFLEQLTKGDSSASAEKNIIGQFGVGFYSTFMVASKVEVFTRRRSDKTGSYWLSTGLGSFSVSEAENVQFGTKIVLHLKPECREFAQEDRIKTIVTRYSNFVGAPIYLNGKRINVMQPLWLLDSNQIEPEMHEQFYKYIANAYDRPRYSLHYKTDAPLSIRALFYVPEYKPTLMDMAQDWQHGSGLSLYSRKVLILPKASNLLPKWLRFIKGVVDSEDIPLNLSREMLQDHGLLKKLSQALTARLIRFLLDQSRKDQVKYAEFYEDYGVYLREGVVTTTDQETREDIAKLLRFESSKTEKGQTTTLAEYASRMKAGSREVLFLHTPNREMADSSPYMARYSGPNDAEVLYCFEPYDELVLMSLHQYDGKSLKSVESEWHTSPTSRDVGDQTPRTLSDDDLTALKDWFKTVLGERIHKVEENWQLSKGEHPCLISCTEMASARHFLRSSMIDKPMSEKARFLQPVFQLNPAHPIIERLSQLRVDSPDLAELLAEQLYENSMLAAGLADDVRKSLHRLNRLLTELCRNMSSSTNNQNN